MFDFPRKTDNENKEDDVSDDEFDHKDLLANSVCNAFAVSWLFGSMWHQAWIQRHGGMRQATNTAKL